MSALRGGGGQGHRPGAQVQSPVPTPSVQGRGEKEAGLWACGRAHSCMSKCVHVCGCVCADCLTLHIETAAWKEKELRVERALPAALRTRVPETCTLSARPCRVARRPLGRRQGLRVCRDCLFSGVIWWRPVF